MKKVLVADDMFWEVSGLIRELKNYYSVEYVPDGRKALEVISGGGIDAAILDYEMPPIDLCDTPEGEEFFGDKVAIMARKMKKDLVLAIRSSAYFKVERKLEPYDIGCFDKCEADEDLFSYLKTKLK